MYVYVSYRSHIIYSIYLFTYLLLKLSLIYLIHIRNSNQI